MGEPHEYVHVSVISFLPLMNHEPLIFHRERINAGIERGAEPPGRHLQPSCCCSREGPWRLRGGFAPARDWVPVASAQPGCSPPSWCAGVQSANGVVCFGLLTLLGSVVLVERSSKGHLCFHWRGGFRAVPTCPGYFLGDPPSLWTNGVLHTCIFTESQKGLC